MQQPEISIHPLIGRLQRICRCLAPDHVLKFPGCLLLAAHVLRTLHPFSVPQTVSGEIRKDIHKGNRFSPLCPQFLWTDGAKWFTFCGYLFVFSRITPAVPDWIR